MRRLFLRIIKLTKRSNQQRLQLRLSREPQGERGVLQEKNYQSSSSSVRTETVFGPPDLLALNHHVANGATDNKDCDDDGNGNTGSRVHGYSNHRRNALVLRKR
jgi:hypothetical protein